MPLQDANPTPSFGGFGVSLGVKKTLAHTDEVLSMIPAVALCGGLILYLLGQVALRARCGRSVAWPRIVAVLTLGALIGVSGEIDALVLLSAVSLVFVLLVAYETVVERTSRRRIRSDEPLGLGGLLPGARLAAPPATWS